MRFGFALPLIAVVLIGCARSEPADTFKPDRAKEKVEVTDSKAVKPGGDAKAGVDATATDVAPKDECATDADFASYRAKLVDAIQKQDFAKLEPLAGKDVKLDFGGGSGLDLLEAKLKEAPAAGAKPLWAELSQLMTLGCALDNGGAQAVMPYYFARSDKANPDHVFPVKAGITLFKTADAKAEVAGTNSGWGPLRLGDDVDWKKAFLPVVSASGDKAFARTEDVRSGIGYRATFARDAAGNWSLQSFLAGD